ncbi:MAG: NADH-quinone oxidoreductase subunit A [Actinomycetota bacterium]|nr:NADH-quinone oxidoreductase subunit A [Acidimicrobiia bacterium]MDQ3293598.1 NADH-quinone oxidoreductase subunit A [Actinomycetota bacterium]
MQYLPLITLLILAIVFCLVSSLVSRLVSPKRPTAAKSAPYECGIVPRRDPPDRFPVRFYLVAMIFIIFDIEIIFLYPYAVLHDELGAFGVGEMVLFAVAVFASFVYLIGNGALDWGPAQRSRRVLDPGMVSATRTTGTTIRRVGLEGRPEQTPEVTAPAAAAAVHEEVPAA